MKFKQHYSSSKGNLYTIETNNRKQLIIDPGVPFSKLQNALNYDLRRVVGCLVTHFHQDHCKAVAKLMSAGIDVYASRQTFDKLTDELDGKTDLHHVKTITPNTRINLGVIEVLSFSTNHCPGSMGFIIKADDQYCLFVTDTSVIPQFPKFRFNIIAVECNYDHEILQKRIDADDINPVAVGRIETHMEKLDTIEYIRQCNLEKCTSIELLHMSSDNIDKPAVAKEIYDEFMIMTKVKI